MICPDESKGRRIPQHFSRVLNLVAPRTAPYQNHFSLPHKKLERGAIVEMPKTASLQGPLPRVNQSQTLPPSMTKTYILVRLNTRTFTN